MILSKSTLILKSCPLGDQHYLHRDGNSGLRHILQGGLALCRGSSVTTFLGNSRLGDGLLDMRKLCLPLSNDLDS